MYILYPILILKYKLDVFLVFDKLLDLCEIKVTKSLILSSSIDPKIFLLQISFAKKTLCQLTPHLDKLNFSHFLNPTNTHRLTLSEPLTNIVLKTERFLFSLHHISVEDRQFSAGAVISCDDLLPNYGK